MLLYPSGLKQPSPLQGCWCPRYYRYGSAMSAFIHFVFAFTLVQLM